MNKTNPTEGPWFVAPSYTIQGVHKLWNVEAGNQNDAWPVVIDCENKSDAELIALTPDMAEAIIAWAEDSSCACYGMSCECPGGEALHDMAKKLRTIIGDNNE